ncbi:MAG: D-glycero-beta-D-manno-heptose-7-phosphate kinase [Candidatus Omnitrophota bacterium]
MRDINFSRLSGIIDNFSKARVMVVGDLILDEFIWGSVNRISPEAPVPVVWVDRESFIPGGASNVANNIAALGAKVELVGIVGKDERGKILKGELSKKGVSIGGVISDAKRPTTLKTRVIAHKQQVVRIDKEHINSVSSETLSKIISYIKKKIDQIDKLIIEDYGKGLITPELLKAIVPLAKRHKKTISVDPKEDHLSFYKGVTVITPNAEEASKAAGIKIENKRSIDEIGKKLLKKLRCKMVLITLGERGMALFRQDGKPTYIPTMAQEVFDVSGAGDTVVGTFSLALASGAKATEAAHIANYAAGIVVGKIGIAVIKRDELLRKIKGEA